jgi:hypothetical protein
VRISRFHTSADAVAAYHQIPIRSAAWRRGSDVRR